MRAEQLQRIDEQEQEGAQCTSAAPVNDNGLRARLEMAIIMRLLGPGREWLQEHCPQHQQQQDDPAVNASPPTIRP